MRSALFVMLKSVRKAFDCAAFVAGLKFTSSANSPAASVRFVGKEKFTPPFTRHVPLVLCSVTGPAAPLKISTNSSTELSVMLVPFTKSGG